MDLSLPFSISLPLFILGFGFLVFVHELGHFLAAKAVGIRTTQFAVGFGHAILCYRKGLGLRFKGTEPEYEKLARQAISDRGDDPEQASPRDLYAAVDDLGLGETEYRLNWIPLGGYVKMLGQEDLDPNTRSDDPRAYNNKSVGARSIVISAGVVMNLIVGALFFVAAFMGGVNFPPNIVGGVLPGSPAATTYAQGHDGDPDYLGLQVGDRIVEADGDVIRDLIGVRIAGALSNPGQPVDFVVERPDFDDPDATPRRLTYRITPQRLDGLSAAQGGRLLGIGVGPTPTTEVFFVVTDSAEYANGVRPGMRVTAVDGKPMRSHAHYLHELRRAAERPVTTTFTDADGTEVTVTQQASPTLVQFTPADPPHLLGWSPVAKLIPQDDTPAARAGVQPGDLLMSINGIAWPTRRQGFEAISEADEPIRLAVWRDGRRIDLPPITKEKGLIGVQVVEVSQSTRFTTTLPDATGASMNAPDGSRVLSIAGEPVQNWIDMQVALRSRAEAITASPDDNTLRTVEIELELMLAGTPRESGTLKLSDDDVAELLTASWGAPSAIAFQPRLDPILADGPIEAVGLGVEYTVRFIQQTYLTLLRLGQGSVSPTELRGPLGIVDVGAQVTQEGWTKFLYFLALISVNLAVINFLPIPITDGGHIVFLLIEKATGKPPSEKVMQWSTLAGLFLIGSVFLFVTYQDILRLAGIAG